jgi:hypothetical protein
MDPTQIQPVAVPSGVPQEPMVAPPQPSSQPVPSSVQPITEEQKQALLDMIQQIRDKIGTLDANKLASGNKNELNRRNLLRQVFEKLQMAGVDLSSRESVASFIMKLQQDSPELAAMFEKAMDVLLGGPEGGSFGVPQDPNAVMDLGAPPQNNMNNANPNEAISQNIQGPFSQAG